MKHTFSPTILITRPAHQAVALTEKIKAAGATPIIFPTLEIRAPKNPEKIIEALEQFDSFDIVIFTSVNAVAGMLSYLPDNTKEAQLKKLMTTQILAIGSATARALTAAGIKVDFFPNQQFDSEALLQQLCLTELANKRIAIFTGEGGRALLQDTLIQRGALVSKVATYQRVCPQLDMTLVLPYWQAQDVAIIISTSCESLENLYKLVGDSGRKWLLNIQLLVISQRMADLAQQLGFILPPIVAKQASDAAIFETLQASAILA